MQLLSNVASSNVSVVVENSTSLVVSLSLYLVSIEINLNCSRHVMFGSCQMHVMLKRLMIP